MVAKLTIKTSKTPALAIYRQAIGAERLVYLAVANKPLHYPYGQSKIVYIGTTKAGANRIAASAAVKARHLLTLYGVSVLKFFVVTCRARRRVKTWRKLESALLLVFRDQFGGLPKGNKQGIRLKWSAQVAYFTRARLESVIAKHS